MIRPIGNFMERHNHPATGADCVKIAVHAKGLAGLA
jgi:hypothetical protein